MRILVLILSISFLSVRAQNGFPFRAITYAELQMKEYAKDTSAVAVVLNEFGEVRIANSEPYNLIFDYHVKIKILKKEGLEQANYEIPLQINGSEKELINEVEASTYNYEYGVIKESKVEKKNFFTEKTNKYWDQLKFTLPAVTIGSVIEVHYRLESPFLFKWRPWEFQTEIPKMKSELWSHIPGTYIYNIVLKGPLKLTKDESSIEKECYTPGGGASADCVLLKYAMIDIPAFKEEKYMTAKVNFMSAVNFELSEIRRFDGRVVKYTEEWKDVNSKLQADENFGDQIKQAKKIWDDQVEILTAGVTDPLMKAKIIFNTIKEYYLWNEIYGHFTDVGAKKAYQTKKGNVADINLSLVGALQSAGLIAEPALVSTRANGLPTMVHPVMTSFNYVIVRLTIGENQYWLDAINKLHPFGFVPERCLNGQVRIIGKNSDWVDLKPKDKDKEAIEVNISKDDDGYLTGNVKITHFGYNAYDNRRKFFSFSSEQEYLKSLMKRWSNIEILSYMNYAADSLEQPFVEKIKFKFTDEASESVLYISPFLFDRWDKNPFRSTERNFPVDFGAPLEQVLIFSLGVPQNYTVDDTPKSTALSIPLNGGRYLFSVAR
ncbi:MAG: DUF3857 domain-containing protein [Cyclobacteriaceae bacterium]